MFPEWLWRPHSRWLFTSHETHFNRRVHTYRIANESSQYANREYAGSGWWANRERDRSSWRNRQCLAISWATRQRLNLSFAEDHGIRRRGPIRRGRRLAKSRHPQEGSPWLEKVDPLAGRCAMPSVMARRRISPSPKPSTTGPASRSIFQT